MSVTRTQIIESLEKRFKNDPSVFAFWLEGADAVGTVDKYSDIDIWLDVKDGQETKTFNKIREILFKLGTVDFEHEKDHPHPKIRQTFFHLKGTPEFLIIDVCIQSHSRKFYYTEGYKDEVAKIIFDKCKVIKFRKFDTHNFKKQQEKRLAELKKTYLFFQAWVKKGLKRNNFLEALSYYHTFVLDPLVEILRMRYEPTKASFGLKHIERDLPKRALEKVQDLYKVSSVNQVSIKARSANRLFLKGIKEIEKS